MKTLFEKLFPMMALKLAHEAEIKKLRAHLDQEIKLSESKQRQIIELSSQRDMYERQSRTGYALHQETLLNAVMEDREALLAENARLRQIIQVHEKRNKGRSL